MPAWSADLGSRPIADPCAYLPVVTSTANAAVRFRPSSSTRSLALSGESRSKKPLCRLRLDLRWGSSLPGSGPSPFACGPGTDYLEAMAHRDEQTITWTWQGAEIVPRPDPRGQPAPAPCCCRPELDLDPPGDGAAAGAALGAFRHRQHRLAGLRRPAAAQARLDAGAHGRLPRLCAAGALPEPGDDRRRRATLPATCCAMRRATPGCAGRLVLLAPTWRGPLPTMMQGPSPGSPRSAAGSTCP